jgi:hypothetical protein
MKIKFILFFIIIRSIVVAQTNDLSDVSQLTFKVEKYKGSIDNSPITMLLTFYPDSNITGYYYYDKVGRLFTIKKSKENKSIKLEAEQIELFNIDNELRDIEIFDFPQSIFENNNTLIGKWIYKGKAYSVNLTKENLKFDWRLFRYKSIGYFKNSPFSEQTKEISIIYPSISSYPKLNAFFLTENYFVDKNMLEFINSSESKYLLIEQNFGENTSGIDDCCWSDYRSSELVYISDSILTYCNDAMAYGYNAQYYTDFISINLSNGEVYSAKNIFKEEFIDTVFTLLRNKFKNVLRQEGAISKNNYEAPLPSEYTENSNIYISKGGVYFRERSYKLANYYDLFLSYDEISNYLNTSFKITIGLK